MPTGRHFPAPGTVAQGAWPWLCRTSWACWGHERFPGGVLRDAQVDPRVCELILTLAKSRTVVRCDTETGTVRLSVAQDAYAAVYPGRKHMDISLEPDAAESAQRQHGVV